MLYKWYLREMARYRMPFIVVGLVDLVLIIITFRYGNLLTEDNISSFFVLMMAILILHNMVLYYANNCFITCNFVELGTYIFFLGYGIILEIAIIIKDLLVESTSEAVTFGLGISIILKIGMIWRLIHILSINYKISSYITYRKISVDVTRLRSAIMRTLIQTMYYVNIYFYIVRMSYWLLPIETPLILVLRVIVILLLIFNVYSSRVLIHVEYGPLRILIVRVMKFAYLFDCIALALMLSPLVDLKKAETAVILTTIPQIFINYTLAILLRSEIKYFCAHRFTEGTTRYPL